MSGFGLTGQTARNTERIRALEADVGPAIQNGQVAQINIVGPTKQHSHEGTGDGGVLEHVLFVEGSAPGTPPTGYVYVYAKSDGDLYIKDDTGTETNLTAAGGTPDADDVTYTPTTLADWDGSADPGDVEQALDQLAERITDVEGGAGGGHVIKENGSAQTARANLNFVDTDAGAGLITDDAGNDETEVNLNLYVLKATTPGGELGGTYSAPTVDATHSGSSHAGIIATHEADTSSAHTAQGVDIVDSGALITATNVETALAELAATNRRYKTITYVIDNGGFLITTGIKGDLEIPFACTINRATALADQSGSIVIDIWKDTYANYPPTDADSITASAPVTISTATKSQDATLTGWTTSISAGDTLRFNVDSVTSITRVTISLRVTVT